MDQSGRPVDFVMRRKRKRLTRGTTRSFGRSTSHAQENLKNICAPEELSTTNFTPLVMPLDACSERSQSQPAFVSSPALTGHQLVTVEEFLTRSHARPTISYGKKRQHVKRKKLRFAQQPTDAKHRSGELSPLDDNQDPQWPNNTSRNLRKGRTRPLADRLFRAAVLAHVDPIDLGGKDDLSTSSRRPLRFVESSGSPPLLSKSRIWNLVDPRKSSPFRLAPSLPAWGRQHRAASATHKSLTQWRTLRDTVAPSLRSAASRAHKKPARSGTDCAPLNFIPLEEAEKSYASKWLRQNQLSRSPISNGPYRPVVTSIPVLPLPQPSDSPIISDVTPTLSLSAEEIQTPGSSDAACSMQEVYSSKVLHDPIDELDYPSTSALLPEKISEVNETPVPHQETYDPQVVMQTNDNKKSLRTWASFLDGFLQTARLATQMQATPSANRQDRTSRKRALPARALPARATSRAHILPHKDHKAS